MCSLRVAPAETAPNDAIAGIDKAGSDAFKGTAGGAENAGPRAKKCWDLLNLMPLYVVAWKFHTSVISFAQNLMLFF